jgi:hypothetical protein
VRTFKGDEWAAYVALDTYDEDERGIAYRTRVLWRRSCRSSRRSHARPGRTGKPSAGRRTTGDRTPGIVRYAKCKEPKRFWTSPVPSRYRSLESPVPGKLARRVRREVARKRTCNLQAPRRTAYPTVRRQRGECRCLVSRRSPTSGEFRGAPAAGDADSLSLVDLVSSAAALAFREERAAYEFTPGRGPLSGARRCDRGSRCRCGGGLQWWLPALRRGLPGPRTVRTGWR